MVRCALGSRRYSNHMATDREYCAETAADEGEALAGTADVVDAWILLEYVPAWTRKATSDNSLSPRTRDWFAGLLESAASRGRRARLQFIRQPELDKGNVALMIAVEGRLHR